MDLFYPSVIMWLNKQLNENQLSRKPETLGKFETPSALSASAGQRMGSASHNMVSTKHVIVHVKILV